MVIQSESSRIEPYGVPLVAILVTRLRGPAGVVRELVYTIT